MTIHLYTTDYQFNNIYDVDELKRYYDYAARDIERAEEAIAKLKAYQMELHKHVQEVVQTHMKKVVVLRRSSSGNDGKVDFNVYVDMRPQLEKENRHVRTKQIHDKRFTGRERHLAIKYAEDLAKQYNCPIERLGFRKR